MLRLSYWERGKKPGGNLGIEVSDSSFNLAGRLDRKFCDSKVSMQGEVYDYKIKSGTIRIIHKQSLERGLYADIELRGETLSDIMELAKKTDLPYSDREVEKIDI